MKYLSIWVSLVTRVAADSFLSSGDGKHKQHRRKQPLKSFYPLMDIGSVLLTAWRSMPTPHCGSGCWRMQVPWQSRSSTIPYPAFRFGCWSVAWALCKWDQHRLWLQKRRGQKGVQRSRGWLKAGSVAWKKKCILGFCSAVLYQLKEECALFLKILQRVP